MKSSLIIAVFLCISSTYVEGQAFTWLTCAAKYANYTAQYQPWFGFSLVSSFSGAISTAAQCDNLASWVRYIDQYYIKSKPSCAGITCPQGQVCRARPAGLTVACSATAPTFSPVSIRQIVLAFLTKIVNTPAPTTAPVAKCSCRLLTTSAINGTFYNDVSDALVSFWIPFFVPQLAASSGTTCIAGSKCPGGTVGLI